MTTRLRRSPGAALLALGVLVSAAAAPATAQGAGPGPAAAPVPLVRFPFPQDDGTLTPYTFQLGYQLMTLVYDTLLWRDEDGVPQPWLARSVEPGPDPRRVTVRLDPRARWHDGRPVTAGDVAFTFDFVAAHPHPRFSPQLEAVEEVDAVDATTVVFTLRHLSPGFADQPLADLPILPAHLWQRLPAGQAAPPGLPVGSGPYRLVRHDEGGYRFEAVTDHHRGRPAVDAVEVPVIPGVDDTVEALRGGDVDAILVGLPRHAGERLRSPGLHVVEVPSYAATVLAFNARRPPFDRVEARLAVAAAVDVRAVTRAAGPGAPATAGHLHPRSPWVPTAVERDTPALRLRPREALPPFEVLVTASDATRVRAAEAVVGELRGAGIEATVVAVSREEFDERTGEGEGDPAFTTAVWTEPALASHDPDYLRAAFARDPRLGTLNRTGYASDAFEAAAGKASTADGRAAREAAVAELLGVLADEAPTVPLFFGSATFAYRSGAYDRWLLVTGTGPLDKRSFSTPGPAPAPEAVPAFTASDPGVSPLGWAAIAVAAMAAMVVAASVARGRGGSGSGRRGR